MSRFVFWIASSLLAWTQVGYALVVGVLGARHRRTAHPPPRPGAEPPRISLIVAAHREESVIAAKVADALALDWPPGRLEIIVAVDGGADADADATALRAREAGADLVLELRRGGKVRAQDAAVARASGELLAFSDANAAWEPDALRHLAFAFEDPAVGYACGRVTFSNESGSNQEGLYWRYEMWIRGNESRLASVTAGNGAIYAVRAGAYIEVDPVMGHDLSLPFNLVKRGWRAVDVPEARATEKMVPSIEGEWARKRRMMSHAWPIVIRGGLLDLRGYPPRYAGMVLSHRGLRYATPLLHLLVLATSTRLARRTALPRGSRSPDRSTGRRRGGPRAASRPLLVARYYVLTTASLAAGLYDWARHGTPAGWDAPEGTR